jgi:hypothetical protein
MQWQLIIGCAGVDHSFDSNLWALKWIFALRRKARHRIQSNWEHIRGEFRQINHEEKRFENCRNGRCDYPFGRRINHRDKGTNPEQALDDDIKHQLGWLRSDWPGGYG